jgi:Domain of unknown function (DUF4173)
MNTILAKLRLPVILVGTLLFYLLFWKNAMGINTLFHFLFSLLCYLLFYPASFRNKSFIASLFGTFLVASAVTFHQSAMAQVFYWFSAFLCIGFAHGIELRTILYATMRSVRDLFYVPVELIMLLRPKGDLGPLIKKLIWISKIAILPAILAFVFLIIYSNSNDVFGSYVGSFFEKIGNALDYILSNFGFAQFLFFTLGGLLTTWMIVSTVQSKYLEKENARKIHLQSADILSRLPSDPEEREHKLGKFMNENASGSLLMILINLMLLGVNLIDVTHYWFGFDGQGINLTQFVHEGTYLLILSILMSMALMLYYFRGYQNFSPKNTRLVLLANIWIFQNALLVISVCIRNFHYIQHSALAYKRIGVFFFLLLVIYGLFTLYLKISGKRTGFYLLKLNSWSTYLVFVILSCINWDGFITKYNLSKVPSIPIDEDFLMNMSNKTLPLLFQNKDKFQEENTALLYHRIHCFLDDKSEESWLSWNYLEAQALVYFETQSIPDDGYKEGRSYNPGLYLNE